MPLQTLNYDSDKERKKYNRIKSNIENSFIKGKDYSSINESNNNINKENVSVSNRNNNDLKSFLGKSFIFSKGFFNKKLILYQFSDVLDTELNYNNTLFRIIPAGEYEFKNKLKQINKSINATDENECKKLIDYFSKFKQESSSNNENFKMNLEKKTPINFDDNIQFLHMQSGKFLKFKKKSDDKENYLYLSKEPSNDTIFRIRPAFSYQIENATNLFYHLSICIACGNKASTHEMCLIRSNTAKAISDLENVSSSIPKGEINNILKENDDLDKIKFEIISDLDKKKKSSGEFIACGHSDMNRWKFFKYSNNFVDDDCFLNNYDYFWIKNCEKDVYVVAHEEEKLNKSINAETFSSTKLADKEEKYPIVNKHTERLIKEGDIFSFSYELMKYIDFEKKLSINVKCYDMNSHNSPFGLFVLEPVNKNFSKENGYTIKMPPDIGPSHYKNFYKIRNVYSNTIICIDHSEFKEHKELKLKLVPHDEVKNIEDCLFMVERMYGTRSETYSNFDTKHNHVRKPDMMRFKSRKSNSYIAIRQLENKIELFLTRNLADLTIFKFDFISQEEKILVNFFYELNFILDLFIQKNIHRYIEENDYTKKLKHIFKILKETLENYKLERVLFYNEDNHKIDVIYNLKEFSIVEKLLKLLFHIWFKRDIKEDYVEKDIEEKGINFESKKSCTDILLNILTIIYDIDHSVLYSIQEYLNYLFLFVGKIDSITHFLIHIMRNNHNLMIKLLSVSHHHLSNSYSDLREGIEIKKKSHNFQVKECMKNLFYLKEIKDEERTNLFFDFLHVMLICNDLPFSSFYKETILQYQVIKFENDEVRPNLDLWFLGDFELENDKILFVKKMRENATDFKIYKFEINFNNSDLEENPHINITKNQFLLLIARNIGLFSDLSLHDQIIRDKLRSIFKFKVITKYITYFDEEVNTKFKENKNLNNIKSSLIKMVDSLYLKQNENLIQNMKLCRVIDNDKFPRFNEYIENFDNEVDEIKENITKQIEKIINDHSLESPVTLQLIETCHYILKYIYVGQIKQKTYFVLNQKTTIFKFISLLLKVLEKLNSKTGYGNKKDTKDKQEVNKEGFGFSFFKRKTNEMKTEIKKEDNELLILEFLQFLRNDIFGSSHDGDSPYYKIYGNLKRKIMHTLISKGKKPDSKETKTMNENYNDINIQITTRICQIFLEFLQFIEFYKVSQIENNLKDQCNSIQEIQNMDNNQKNSIIKDLIGFKEDQTPSYLNILDEFIGFHSTNSLVGNTERKVNSYRYSVSNIFFDCLQEENMQLKILIFDVIYRMNSQKLIFFENISNLVVLKEDEDCLFFEKIMDLFAQIKMEITKFTNYSIKDKTMKSAGINIQDYLKELCILFENIIKTNEAIFKVYDEDDYVNLFKNEINKGISILSIDHVIEEKNLNKSSNLEKTKYTQYILNNINTVDIIVSFMEKAKEIISQFKEDTEIIEFFEEIQETLEFIYNLLYIFIFNNKKHKLTIEEDLEILLFPIRNKKIININLRKSISKFILEYTRDFGITELNNSEKLIEMIYDLITQTDVKNDTSCIGYFIEILKIIIIKPTAEINEKISLSFDYLKKGVMEDLNNIGLIERIYLRDILRLVIYVNKKMNHDENENKMKFIIHLQEIFTIFDMLKKNDWKEIYFEIINLAIDYLYLNCNYYKFELAGNKKILRSKNPIKIELELILNQIEKLFPESNLDGLIYVKDLFEEENEEILAKVHVNFFVGHSILKMNQVIIEISKIESIRKPIKDSLDKLLLLSLHFYSSLKNKILSNEEINSHSFLKYCTNFNEIKEITSKLSVISFKEITDLYSSIIKQNSTQNNNIKYLAIDMVKKENKINIVSYWDQVKEILNDPLKFININLSKKTANIFTKISELINSERIRFVDSIIEFAKVTDNYQSKDNLNNIEIRKSGNYNFLIVKILNNVFVNMIDKNYKFIDQLYFYFWTLIYFMKYSSMNKNHTEETSIPNIKNIISEIKFQNLIVKILRKKNLKCVDYSISLLINFLNVYLEGLEDGKKSQFLSFLINQSESEYIFILIKNVLEDLKAKLSCKPSAEKDIKSINPANLILTKYEKLINPYEEVTKLISTLLENNPIVKNQMKLYLRFQYNNSKSHNFLNLISTILELFIENIDDIHDNYSIIINCIDTLTRCCSGPCPENQNSLVVDTKIINCASNFLFNVSYRNKNLKKNIKKNHSKASFIKYKLILLLASMVQGRNKYDKLFLTISSKLNIESLMKELLVETVEELLYEKNVDNLEKLRLTEDMYQRFEKIENKESEGYIIFEIGTYTFILINLFYDSLHENYKEDLFFKKIFDLKKKLKNKQQSVMGKTYYANFLSFGEKIVNLFKGFCLYCLSRYYQIQNRKNLNINVTEEAAYEFYFNYTPKIEIVYRDIIIKYYVKLYPMCKYLNDEMKQDFQENIDRTNTKSKLSYLFKSLNYIKEALQYRFKIEDYFQRYPAFDLLFNEYHFYKDFSYILTIAINSIILASYYRVSYSNTTYIYDYAFFYNPQSSNETLIVLRALSITQIVICIMLYTNYVIISLPKYTYQNDKQENKSSFVEASKIFIFLKRLFLDKEFIYNTFYFLMAFLGIYWKNYLFFTAHLLEIVRRSETLINVINAFWYPKKQILVTLILFLMVEYIFTIFVFTYYGDDALDYNQNKFCDYFVRCYLTIIDNTFKLPNGLMNLLSSQGYEQNFYLGGRFWLDNIFAIIVVMLILQMLAGIIVDNFSALRERQQIVNEDKFNICFICGLHKNKLNKLYSNEDGFNEHIKLDHYYWNYLFLIMNILRKEEKDLNEIDSEIKTNYNNQSFIWIPNERYGLFKGRCEKLDDEKKREL